MINPGFVLQASLLLLSIIGLITVGGGFYSGTKLKSYSENNWVYILMIFLGVFSFTVGVVGLFGTKYLTPVLYMLVPLTVGNIIKVVLFFSAASQIELEGLLEAKVISFFKIFGIIECINKILSIYLIAKNVSSLRKLEESQAKRKHLQRSKVVKGVADSLYRKREEKIKNYLAESIKN